MVNINKDYPIEKIEVNNENIEIDVNENYTINMNVTPASSYAYQRVNVDVADPSIVKVGYYEGLDLPIQGLKPVRQLSLSRLTTIQNLLPRQ